MRYAAIAVFALFVLGLRMPSEAAGGPVSPLELNSKLQSLSDQDKKKIQAAFDRMTKTPQSINAVSPNAIAPAHPTVVTDPVSGAVVNVDAAVAASISIQRLWQQKTGRALRKDEVVDLNVLAGAQPVTGHYQTSGTQKQQVAPSLNVSGSSCSAAINPDDLDAAWAATMAFRLSPSDSKICTLPYATVIQQVSQDPATVFPAIPKFSQSFGDPKTAQGTFVVEPSLTLPAGAKFDAAFDVKFSASLLSGKYNRDVLDGRAEFIVPNSGPITSKISVTGDAFPDNSLFTQTQSYIDGSFTYTGSPAKDFTFYSVSKTYSVPIFPLVSTSVTIATAITGSTSLTYSVQGGASGIFAKAIPLVKAGANTSVTGNLIVGKVSVKGDVTVQNSNSQLIGFVTLVPYQGAIYGVERIRAVYAPFDYQATIIATGSLIGFEPFKLTLFDTGEKPVSVGAFTEDSNWRVQRVIAAPPVTPNALPTTAPSR